MKRLPCPRTFSTRTSPSWNLANWRQSPDRDPFHPRAWSRPAEVARIPRKSRPACPHGACLKSGRAALWRQGRSFKVTGVDLWGDGTGYFQTRRSSCTDGPSIPHKSFAGISLENPRNALHDRDSADAVAPRAIAHDQHPVTASGAQHRVHLLTRGMQAEPSPFHVRQLVKPKICLDRATVAKNCLLGNRTPIGLMAKPACLTTAAADLRRIDLDDRDRFHMA